MQRIASHGICYRNSVCSSPYGSPIILVSGDIKFIPKFEGDHPELSGDTTVNDLGHISRSLDCFTSNFSKTVCDTAKVTIDN